MKKGNVVRGKIAYVDFPAKGMMKVEKIDDSVDGITDEMVAVKGTVPGQKVTAVINKGRKGKYEARLLSVDEKSPLESGEPFCPYFGLCGGCSYQTLGYENQLELKAGQVKKLLDGAVRNQYEYEFEPPLSSPLKQAYRNKMEFTFGNEYKDGPLVVGLHKKGSFYDIVPVYECGIIAEEIREILKAVGEWAAVTNLGFYHKMKKEGYFRHLLVRRSEKNADIMVDLITTSYPENRIADQSEEKLLESFKDCLLGLSCSGKIKSILHTKNDSAADAVIDEGTEILYGSNYFSEELLGLNFKITPFSFFQTNSLGAEVLYSKVREYALEAINNCDDKVPEKTGVIYDLYSGTGTIGQLMSKVADKVFGIEIIEEAVAAANENAALNGLDNCSFIAGDVLKKLDELNEKPDLIILDPPRDGIHPKAIGKILAYGVQNMVYISCKPSSLARDLAAFHATGYRMIKAACVDMFPWTSNVETVCLLSNTQRKKKESYITLDVEMEDYYRIKNEGKNSTT